MRLEEQAGGRIRVVHMPKTIDNDVDLPAHVDTFGFRTARHHGAVIAEGLVLNIDPADLAGIEEVERDAHGHIRIAEVNIGELLKAHVDGVHARSRLLRGQVPAGPAGNTSKDGAGGLRRRATLATSCPDAYLSLEGLTPE